MSRSVITGGAGFIGSHLAEALLEAGEKVVSIDAFTPYYAPALKRANIANASHHGNFELLPADLNELELDEILRPGDTVYHLAAQPGVRRSWGDEFTDYARHNIEATQRLLEAARRRRVHRLIYASSSSVYGNAPLPMEEDGPLHPVSPYGVSKRTAEELCLVYWRSFEVPVVPLRFFTVYGPRQRPDMAFNLFIRAVVEGRPLSIYGDGTQLRDFTYVGDVVSVLMAAAERAEPGVPINVGGGSAVSVLDAIRIIERLTGRRAICEHRPAPPGDARDTLASTDRLHRLGAAVRTPVDQGLERQVAWQLDSMSRARRPPTLLPGRVSSRKPEDTRPRRLLLYSHDGYGLGHLRRNTAIAHALVCNAPDSEVVMLSASPVAADWPLPAGVRVVRLPSAVKTGPNTYAPVEPRSMSGVRAERAGIIHSTLLKLRPEVLLVDHSPLGIRGELALALEAARQELPETRLILGLRDILDEPASVRRDWQERDIYRVIDEAYDQILVYGCRHLYDVTRQYQFPASIAARTVFTGYVSKDRGLEPAADGAGAWPDRRGPDHRRILVMGGGGGDAEWLFRGFLKALARLRAAGLPASVLMVMGPLMADSSRASIERRAAQVGGVRVVSSSKSVLSLIASADLVVSMGGYNTVVEVLAARKPLVICPRVAPRREQLIRARMMSRLGLARVVRLETESSKALAQAVLEYLQTGPSDDLPWPSLDLGGAARVAAGLLDGGLVEEAPGPV